MSQQPKPIITAKEAHQRTQEKKRKAAVETEKARQQAEEQKRKEAAKNKEALEQKIKAAADAEETLRQAREKERREREERLKQRVQSDVMAAVEHAINNQKSETDIGATYDDSDWAIVQDFLSRTDWGYHFEFVTKELAYVPDPSESMLSRLGKGLIVGAVATAMMYNETSEGRPLTMPIAFATRVIKISWHP